MKKFTFLLLTLSVIAKTLAQSLTNTFKITGEVKDSITITLADLKKLPFKTLDSFRLLNHKGEPRGGMTNLKGVLLKDVLALATLKEEAPKKFSEFYFICQATDGYKVIFSWNEVFNNPSGEDFLIILEADAKSFDQLEKSVLLIAPKDIATGRRHIKWLTRIEVARAK